MPDYGNRPRRRAAIQATARLQQQAGNGRPSSRRRGVVAPLEPPTGRAAVAPMIQTPDAHHIAIPQGPDAPNGGSPEPEHNLPPVPNTVHIPECKIPEIWLRCV